MELYDLLPEVLKRRDSHTSPDPFEPRDDYGYADLSTGPVIQRFVDCIQQELEVTAADITGLSALLDPRTCREDLLVLIARFLGSTYVGAWSVERKRLYVSSLVSLYHEGGTSACWYALLRLLGYSKSTIYELWKSKLNEDSDYSRLEEYDTLAAARIDVLSSTDVLLNASFTEIEHAVFDNFRPIHVLLRSVMLSRVVADTNTNSSTDDQAVGAGLSVEETLSASDDSDIQITVNCARSCETTCQAGCTTSCETGCETGCEVSCETGCEVSHEAYYGEVSAVDPLTYGPVVLAIADGQAGSYSGDVSFVDPLTYGPVVLTLVDGVVTTVFTGDVQGIDSLTGEPVMLYVEAGRFYS